MRDNLNAGSCSPIWWQVALAECLGDPHTGGQLITGVSATNHTHLFLYGESSVVAIA